MTEVQIQGVAMSKDGLQAHYVASDPRASYTLVNAKVELGKYNPAFTEWVSGHKVDYNLMPPEGLEQHYSKSVVKNHPRCTETQEGEGLVLGFSPTLHSLVVCVCKHNCALQ